MKVQPYLDFNGRCEEAIQFYKNALGAEVQMLMRFKDSPEPANCGGQPANIGEKVMHSSLQIGDSVIMASDGRCTGATKFQGISLTITVDTEAKAERAFAALSDGGAVCMPLAKTFYSPKFGMVTDRFGILWMVMATPQ